MKERDVWIVAAGITLGSMFCLSGKGQEKPEELTQVNQKILVNTSKPTETPALTPTIPLIPWKEGQELTLTRIAGGNNDRNR